MALGLTIELGWVSRFDSASGLWQVYDFGGGTLDVSLLSFESGMFTVVASSGNAALGGEDFTHALARCMLRKFLQRAQPRY